MFCCFGFVVILGLILIDLIVFGFCLMIDFLVGLILLFFGLYMCSFILFWLGFGCFVVLVVVLFICVLLFYCLVGFYYVLGFWFVFVLFRVLFFIVFVFYIGGFVTCVLVVCVFVD